MAQNPGVRVHQINFQSSATSSNTQYIGNATRMFLVYSSTTQFNAGAGNTTLNVLGAYSDQSSITTFATIPSCQISTSNAGVGIFPLPYTGIPWIKIEFGTAPTGAAVTNSSGQITNIKILASGD